MGSYFENRYTVSKKVFLEWSKRPITTDVFTYLWMAFAIIIIAFTVISIMSGDVFFIIFNLFMLLFCIYRIFFRKKLLFSKQFQNIAVTQGKNEWERVIEFSDKISINDGNITGVYEWGQVKEIIIDRENLILVMGKRLGLRIDKSGFVKGTYESFIDYLKQEHNNIPIKVRNK